MSTKKYAAVALSLLAPVLAALALLAAAACKSKPAEEKIITNRIEQALEKATGSKVNIDLKDGTLKVKTADGENVLTTGERRWPEDLPEGAVEFEHVKVQTVSRTATEEGRTWIIHVTGVGAGALDRYSEKLKADGWAIAAASAIGSGGTVAATKADLKVHVTLAANGKTGVITFVRKTNE